MCKGGVKIWPIVLLVLLASCSSASASDLDDAGNPLTTIAPTTTPASTAASSTSTSSSSSSSSSTSTSTTSTTVPPTTTEPPVRVDCDVERCIALTFDDGPAPTTPALLDVLAAQDVPATFFMLGLQVDEFPEIVQRVQAEGHEIGNHTYDHRKLTATSLDAARVDVARGAASIQAVTGEAPRYLRPPQGATSAEVRAAMGVPEVLWTVDPEDWLTKDTDKTILRVAQGAQPGRIILMHDIYDTSVAAVTPIIELLRSHGYTFVTVSELLGPDLAPDQTYRERTPT